MTLGRRTLFSSSLFIRNQRLSCSLSPPPCPARRLDRVSLASLPHPVTLYHGIQNRYTVPFTSRGSNEYLSSPTQDFNLVSSRDLAFRCHSCAAETASPRTDDRPARERGARTRNRLSLLALSDGCESPTPTRLIMVSSLFANSSLFP